MIWDTNTNSVKMVIIKMMKIWIFGKDYGEFAWHEFINESVGDVGENNIFRDGRFRFWNKGKDFI